MSRPFTDWDDPYWRCSVCGCRQGDHTAHVETDGYGAFTTHHIVTDCEGCGECAGFRHDDNWAPTEETA